MGVRVLGPDDAETYHGIRKRAIREHPEEFYTSVAEEEALSLEEVRKRLGRPDAATFGAFDGDSICGMIGFWREAHEKGRHKAYIWGMYVASESQGKGAGRLLMQAALDRIRSLGGVEQVLLAVRKGNEAATGLYKAMGFEGYGVEPRAMKLDGHYTDEEMMVCRL